MNSLPKSFQTCLTLLLLAASIFGLLNPNPTTPEDYSTKIPPHLLRYRSKVKHKCTNGKNPKKLSIKSYLSEFAKGPCSPLVIVPGISASKLRIIIENCSELKKQRPEIFRACGWSHCIKFLPGSPKSEYLGWIPINLSPMSVIVPTAHSRNCFIGLSALNLTTDKSSRNFVLEKVPGVRLVPEGESPGTSPRKKGRCGASAVNNISVPHLELEDTLLSAGYRNGLTLQYLPYDWRKSIAEENLQKKFERIFEELNELTGKRSNVIGQSMGNYVTLNTLWKMTQEKKDKLVSQYFNIGGPLLGSPEPNYYLLGGASSYSVDLKILKVGITFEMGEKTILNFPALYQLSYKNTFNANKGTEWLNSSKLRIEDELYNRVIRRSDFLSVLPPISESCTSGFSEVEDGCKLGFREINDFGEVAGKKINTENFFSILKEFSFVKNAATFEKVSLSDNMDNLVNPGVRTIIMFANHLKTVSGFRFATNPLEKTLNKKFSKPEKFYQKGDGTVTATSAALPALKWMYDALHPKTGAEKPVHLAHVCGSYNIRESSLKDSGKNAFYGVECGCKTKSKKKRVSGKKCDHNGITYDAYVAKFISESVMDGQIGRVGDRFEKMTEKELKRWWNRCQLLNGID